MGSPFSDVVANIYMELFENKSIETHPLITKVCRRFIEDTYAIWLHGRKP
jgi:hypothetical protein